MNTRVGLITAAGASQRMGQPKAALCFPNGTSFVQHMAQCLRETGHTEIYLSLPNHALSPAFVAHLKDFGVKIISNPNPDQQQLGSIIELLRLLPQAPASILVWPVDTPFAEKTHIATLYQSFEQKPEPGLITLTVDDQGGHPLLLGASFFPYLHESAEKDGLRGLRGRFPQHVHSVPQADPRLCANINTPDQYRKAFAAEPQFLPNSLYFVQ